VPKVQIFGLQSQNQQMMRYRRNMSPIQAAQQLRALEPVPEPPSGPTYDHIVGNQIRWAVKVLRYERYRWRKRRLEKTISKQEAANASHRTSQA
jgi:hypothetical protein